MALPLDTVEQARQWDTAGADVLTALETRFPCFEVEHHVWHFFADADVRQRDPGYRQQQHQTIADYVSRLRIPDISRHTRGGTGRLQSATGLGQVNHAGRIGRMRELYKSLFIGLLSFTVVLALFRLLWK